MDDKIGKQITNKYSSIYKKYEPNLPDLEKQNAENKKTDLEIELFSTWVYSCK